MSRTIADIDADISAAEAKLLELQRERYALLRAEERARNLVALNALPAHLREALRLESPPEEHFRSLVARKLARKKDNYYYSGPRYAWTYQADRLRATLLEEK